MAQIVSKPQVPDMSSHDGFDATKISQHDVGLKVFREPPDVDDVEVDVVAVHGIGASPNTTWTHKETNVNWLSNDTMLPAALPNARIMAFGYNSLWFGEHAVRQTVEGIATALLVELSDMRIGFPRRPVIFIGHCFGGLVIQQAYTMAALHTTDWPNMDNCITGIVFLGTPHQGIADNSNLSTQGKIYAAIAQANLQIQADALKSMTHHQEVLVNTVHNFARKVSTSVPRTQLYCFYEQKTSKVGRIAGLDISPEFIVDEVSSSLPGSSKQGLDLDHFHMNKYLDSEDSSYKRVKAQILKMSKQAVETTEEGRAVKLSPKSSPRPQIPTLAAPIAKEANFAPRGGVLEAIEAKFRIKVHVALYGGSGNGKTHIAVEYAHKYHQEHLGSNIYWVNCASSEQFELSYKRISENLQLSKEACEANGVVEAVRHYLKKDSGASWLMVLDGLEDEEKLVATDSGKPLLDFMPTNPHARVLITTRSKRLATRMVRETTQYIIPVNPLRKNDASHILFGKVSSNPAKMKWVEDLTEALGGSAGALTLALAFRQKSEKRFGTKKYLETITAQLSKVSGVTTAWQLLHGLLKSDHPETADLMLLVCALDVQCIPSILFERHQLYDQIPTLEAYGVVEPQVDRRLFYITPLFRDLARTWLAKHSDERASTEELALYAVLRNYNPETAETLLPCALAVMAFQTTSTQSKRDMATLLFRVSQHCMQLGRYRKAIQCLERCLKLREADQDSDKKQALVEETKQAMAQAVNLLSQPGSGTARSQPKAKGAQVSGSLGSAKEQLQDCESSDAQWQHRNTVRKASDTAALRLMHGQKDGTGNTVELYERVLGWCQEKHGANHVDTARTQYNLAIAHGAQGQYDEAEDLFRSALGVLQSQIKPEKPDLALEVLFLKVLGSLGSMYCSQGRLDEAEAAFRVVLPGQLAKLGLNHPETLVTRHDVALLLQQRGNLDTVAEELREVLLAQSRLLEANDPGTLRTARSIALNHQLKGKQEEAKNMYTTVLRAQTNALGETHRDTVETGVRLEELLVEMKK
ncbi:hypothetical protein AK830_g7714 [Neonectria ditissima]|uniref:NB-ARC domain-containing protein n=1 Tax=Neonectria ditissima TaxID=78410 RepID=A0A0P7AWG2_9HYPO|nr:hypothetical protein AK830_g7714 [Neonectria ditissima]